MVNGTNVVNRGAVKYKPKQTQTANAARNAKTKGRCATVERASKRVTHRNAEKCSRQVTVVRRETGERDVRGGKRKRVKVGQQVTQNKRRPQNATAGNIENANSAKREESCKTKPWMGERNVGGTKMKHATENRAQQERKRRTGKRVWECCA